VQVLAAGAPRPAAQAKHCDWVLDRQPLEQLKQQAGADEVVLLSDSSSSSSSSALLEGLASNFYVVADAAELAACGQALTAADVAHPGDSQQQQSSQQQQNGQQQQQQQQLDGLVLLTTGPASSDALLGVTQQRVLQACQSLQLPVVLQPPKVHTAAAWREAFLTNWWVGCM
jgi:hypothetical protein